MFLFFHIEAAEGRVVRVSALQCADDGAAFNSLDLTVRPPDCWSVPAGMTRTNTQAQRFGVIEHVPTFALCCMAQTAHTIVAHGLAEQAELVKWQLIRHGVIRRCTAKLSAPLFKDRAPTFDEARAQFNVTETGAAAVKAIHDALQRRGLIE